VPYAILFLIKIWVLVCYGVQDGHSKNLLEIGFENTSLIGQLGRFSACSFGLYHCAMDSFIKIANVSLQNYPAGSRTEARSRKMVIQI
jgi:hypothetical protein